MGEQVDARSNGDVAQLGEHLPCKQGVESSNLFISIQKLLAFANGLKWTLPLLAARLLVNQWA